MVDIRARNRSSNSWDTGSLTQWKLVPNLIASEQGKLEPQTKLGKFFKPNTVLDWEAHTLVIIIHLICRLQLELLEWARTRIFKQACQARVLSNYWRAKLEINHGVGPNLSQKEKVKPSSSCAYLNEPSSSLRNTLTRQARAREESCMIKRGFSFLNEVENINLTV